jgi:hypothetical protein
VQLAEKHTRNPEPGRRTAVAATLAAALGAASPWAGAFQIDTGNPDVKVNWDNTVKYNVAWRLNNPDPALTTASTNNATNARNYNDGDLNFKRGLISNRVSLLSELDATYGNVGFRVTGSAWYDSVYMGTNDNPGGSTNQRTGAYNEFSQGTESIHGQRAEILDAFAFGKFDLDGHRGSVRIGKHGLVWGETLFFGANGMAGTMAPTDVGKLQSVPGTPFKEATIPVKQISGQVALTDDITMGAFYQFEWRANRLAGSGSYFSASDATGPGAERLVVTPVAAWMHGNDITPKNSGQGGLELRFRLPEGETDYGLYATRYHDKGFAGLITRGLPTNMPAVPAFLTSPNAYYQVVYGEGISAYGFSASRTFGAVNLAGEVSVRQNVPLVSYNMSAPLTSTLSASVDQGIFAVGNSAHANLSALWSVPATPLFNEANFVGEIGWNRRTSITRNAANLDPRSERDAWGWRFVFSPMYRQVLPGLDIAVPIGLSYNPHGKSSVVSVFNNTGIDKGGDFSIGLDGSYLDDWRFTLTYTHFYGDKGLFQNGLNGSAVQVKTFQNYFADRDFISVSLRRTF